MKRKQNKSPKARFTFWSVVVILLLVLAAIGPLFMRHDPFMVNLTQVNMAPCWEYPLGTDYIGRCILCRLIEGAARSIYSALIVVAITFVVGTLIGTLSGFFGGAIDTVLMRIVDCFQAFPSMVFTIAVAGILGIGMKKLHHCYVGHRLDRLCPSGAKSGAVCQGTYFCQRGKDFRQLDISDIVAHDSA